MRKISIKMHFFYFRAISYVMGYHDGTQNFIIEKYGILAFKWRVLSIFSISGSKVIPKNKRMQKELDDSELQLSLGRL